MTDQSQTRLRALMAKARVVVERNRQLSLRLSDAQQRITDLETRNSQLQREVSTLEDRLAYLSMTLTLSPTKQDVDMTRNLLSELVREIDKCIEDLSGTPGLSTGRGLISDDSTQ